MTISTHFLFATLRWRGFKHSPNALMNLLAILPQRLSSAEYQDVLESHFLIPKKIGQMWFETCLKEYSWLHDHNAQYVTYFDVEYPDYFKTIEDPPMILTWWGNISGPHEDFISVVGTRNPSRETLLWMDQHLDTFLRANKTVVVSGGARGIDQKAHMLALRNSRATVCVVPAGLKHLYPEMLERWKHLILELSGAIASPFSPLSPMEKRFFVERNRYIAGWSKLTFILEAKRRSGTMVTARWAKRLDREIAVLPCAPNTCGMGGLDLIVNEGAVLIRDYKDLVTVYNRARVKSLPVFEVNEFQQSEIKDSGSTLTPT